MSTRNTILEAYKTLLEGITTDNGYTTNVTKVVRKHLFLDNEHEFPVLMVLGGTEEITEVIGDTVKSDLLIRIRGISLDKDNPESALCNIVGDILERIEHDDNSYKDDQTLLRVLINDEEMTEELSGYGIFEVQLLILYSYDKGSC